MRYTAELFLDWLNLERPIPGTSLTGGLMVGGRRYSMRFVWTDDKQSASEASVAIAHSFRRDNGAHFGWGGYGSTMSRLQAEQAELDGKLFMASIAAAPSVFTDRELVFGGLPPDYTYIQNAVRAVAQAATGTDDVPAASSLTVGIVYMSPLDGMCAPIPQLAQDLGMNVVEDWLPGNRLERFPSEDAVDSVLSGLRDDGVNFIVGCVYHDGGEAIVEGLERLNFAPVAAAFTSTVDISVYQDRVGAGWWQGEYALGVSPWHSSLTHRGSFSGMTSAEYLDRYETRTGEKPSYHGPASFSAACALAAAIEAAGSLEATDVAAGLRSLNMQELGFFSPMSFSEPDGQNRPEMLVLQFPPAQTDLKIVYPLAVPGSISIAFPTPKWGKRRCVALGSGAVYGGDVQLDDLPTSECSGHGSCELAREQGGHEVYECACEAGWLGDNCELEYQTTNVSIALLFPRVGDASAALQLEAAQLAIQAINSNGLIPGHQFRVVHIDTSLLRALSGDQLQRTQVEQIRQLLTLENVVLAVGAGYSSDVAALAPALDNTMLLSPSASAASLSNVSAFPTFGRLIMSDDQQSIALADIVRRGGWKKVGVVRCDDLYCSGLTQGTLEQLSGLGITDVEMLGTIHEQGGAQTRRASIELSIDTVRQWLQNCAEWPEDSAAVVLLLTHKAEGEEILASKQVSDLPTDWIGSEAMGSSSLSSDAAKSGRGVGPIALRPGGRDPSHTLYESLATQLPDGVANVYALRAFDAVYVIAHAIRALLNEDADAPIDDVRVLVQSAQAVVFEGASGDVQMNEQLDRVGSYEIVQFKSGLDNETMGLVETVGAWNADDGSIRWNLSPRTENPCTDTFSEITSTLFDQEWALPSLLAVVALICLLATGLAIGYRNSIRKRTWSTFLSHSKRDGGDIAALFKRQFDKRLRKRCGTSFLSTTGESFLDVESLDEITAPVLVQGVKRSKVFVLLLSRSLLTRPWYA